MNFRPKLSTFCCKGLRVILEKLKISLLTIESNVPVADVLTGFEFGLRYLGLRLLNLLLHP